MRNNCTIKDGVATMRLTQGKSMLCDEADLPKLAPHLRAKAVRDAGGSVEEIKAAGRGLAV